MTYRILFAPDGEHWVNDSVNNRKDPSQAVLEINEFCYFDKFARAKLVNTKTGFVLYERSGGLRT